MAELPKIPNLTSLQAEIRLVPERHREDAIQEAWAAHLCGDCPIKAVGRFKKREMRRERREVAVNPSVMDGSEHYLQASNRLRAVKSRRKRFAAPRQSIPGPQVAA